MLPNWKKSPFSLRESVLAIPYSFFPRDSLKVRSSQCAERGKSYEFKIGLILVSLRIKNLGQDWWCRCCYCRTWRSSLWFMLLSMALIDRSSCASSPYPPSFSYLCQLRWCPDAASWLSFRRKLIGEQRPCSCLPISSYTRPFGTCSGYLQQICVSRADRWQFQGRLRLGLRAHGKV